MPLYVSTQACRGYHLMITQRTLQKTVVLAFDMVFASSVFKRQLGMVVIICDFEASCGPQSEREAGNLSRKCLH